MADKKLGPPYSTEFLARRTPQELKGLKAMAKAKTFDEWLVHLDSCFDEKGGKR